MWEILGPPARLVAVGLFVTGCALLFLGAPDLAGLGDFLRILAAAVGIVLFTAWLTVKVADDPMPEPEFRRLVDRSERLAKLPPPESPPSDFDELVVEALDELPEEYRELLETTPVVVSRRGHEVGAYGHYIGDTVARDGYPDRIVIYQDTLERDFGWSREGLRRQVQRTVRHELAHHLGWDEAGVRSLGL